MKISVPDSIPGMLLVIPQEKRPQGEEVANFYKFVAYELGEMLREAGRMPEDSEPMIVLNMPRVAGEQYIYEFYAANVSKPAANEYNWHGQNVSQWAYGGCILVQNGKVSSHH